MKKIITLIFLITISICSAQTSQEQRAEILRLKKELAKQKSEKKKSGVIDCDDIVVREIELKDETYYSLPPKVADESVTLNKVRTGKDSSIFITLNVMSAGCSYREKGVYIKLSNGEILKFPESKVSCSYMRGGGYFIAGSLVVDESLYEKLSAYDIVEFNLDNYNKKVKHKNPEAFKVLLKCLHDE